MKTRLILVSCVLAYLLTIGCSTFAATGPIIMVHGHRDSPALWTIQGRALAKASGGARFYDSRAYYAGDLPSQFKTNGIYGVGYYTRQSHQPLSAAPIAPVRIGTTEIPPDNAQLYSPFLYNKSDSYAKRLSEIINDAYADTGKKVTLICHSMGGLVSLSAITYYGCQNKVEKLITIGTPLRGFPTDYREPAELLMTQQSELIPELLQMSEGVLYAGQSFSAFLESRFKVVKPVGLSAVNIVGTLSPFPDLMMLGPSDGVVRAIDEKFRNPALATVYELPLTHVENYLDLTYRDEDVECLSSRTTQILEKEVLGLVSVPRLGSYLALDYSTGRIRVTLSNDGGLPVTFSTVSGEFAYEGADGKVVTTSLPGLLGQTLAPGASVTVDGPAMNLGEKGTVGLTLTVNGTKLPRGNANFLANIQAPEIEASIRYDFANSALQYAWASSGGNLVTPIQWNAQYRIEGQVAYDANSEVLSGSLAARFGTAVTGLVNATPEDIMFAESFRFDLDHAANVFSNETAVALGQTEFQGASAANSQFRGLYREILNPLTTQPGAFLVEGQFSALAALQLDRPVVVFDTETQSMALNVFGSFRFAFTLSSDSEQVIDVPVEASCALVFRNDARGLVWKPQVRRLKTGGVTLSENYRKQINQVIEAHELVVVPADLSVNLNLAARDALIEALGPEYVPGDFKMFDTVTAVVDCSPTRLRIALDLFDDAAEGGQNSYAGVPENGVAVQDRLINQMLERTRHYANLSLLEKGITRFPLGFEVPVPYTDYYLDYPILGPISLGVGFGGLYYYMDRIDVTFSESQYRPLQLTFNTVEQPLFGSYNVAHFDIPVDTRFVNQVRSYLAARVGISIPFIGFVGYTKRCEIESRRVQADEIVAMNVDVDANPYLATTDSEAFDPLTQTSYIQKNAAIGVRFDPRTIELDTDFHDSTFFGNLMGEGLVEPVFNVMQNNPEWLGPLGMVLGGALGAVAPHGLRQGVEAMDTASMNAMSTAFADGVGADTTAEDLRTGGSSWTFDFSGTDYGNALDELGSSASLGGPLAWIGAYAGASVGASLEDPLREAFSPKQVQTVLPSPANVRLSGLSLANRAASMTFDIDPGYGELYVTKIEGLDALNSPVALSRDDVVLLGDSNNPLSLTYKIGSERMRFTTLWVKKPVAKLRFHFAYEAQYVQRYNAPGYPDYRLKCRQMSSGPLAVPADYVYDSERDTSTFSMDIPVTEGVCGASAVQLRVPNRVPATLPFLTGRDTAPILINGPYAGYRGDLDRLTVDAGTLVYRNTDVGASKPNFTLTELKIMPLDRDGELVDIKPLGATTTHALGQGDTRVQNLYGVDYAWSASLPLASFPEGVYAVLVSIRENSLAKQGSLFIPVLIDRTPPDLRAWTIPSEPGVVSRHVSMPVIWYLNDVYSAVMSDVGLTTRQEGGAVVGQTLFTSNETVLIPGQRRLDYSMDLSAVPDGVEQLHTISFEAKDACRNRGVSSNVTFVVDTRPPSLDALFVYPVTVGGTADVVLNTTNRILTVKVHSHEPFTARFSLNDTQGTTNAWYAASSTNGAPVGVHRAVWVLELPPADPDQGLRDGTVADGLQSLSLELTDRGLNVSTFHDLKTILVDRTPPTMTLRTQQTFLPDGRTVYPLDLNTSSFTPDDRLTSIALVNLNGFMATSSVYSATLRTWSTPVEMAAVLASGVPLDPVIPGSFLPSGHYGIQVTARDTAGNESRISTRFAFRLIKPHVEVQGFPKVGGVAPILGIASDPNPGDRFTFHSRELYWAFGASVPAPANLDAIPGATWKRSGLYVLPPRGATFATNENMSAEMVPEGILAYWNTTASPIPFEGDAQTVLSPAGIVNSDVTLLLVVRDEGGQAWAQTCKVHVDNRQTDINALTKPGLRILDSHVANHQLTVSTALLRDMPNLQMVILDHNGAGVHQAARSNVESQNRFFGRPTYSLENDFGFFAWYDESVRQLRIRCVAPERSPAGALLPKGHTFHFSITGGFATNDVSYYQVPTAERPIGNAVSAGTDGVSRVTFSLSVDPGAEKGVNIAYQGGALTFNAIGIDDYLQVLYENGSVVERRFWRADDAASIFPGNLGTTPVRNLVGLDGIVMNGAAVDLPGERALANHTGALGHVFVGSGRNEPISPLRLRFASDQIVSDLTLGWDLRLPNGAFAEPGDYRILLYGIDAQYDRMHGAVDTFTLTPSDVPFAVSGLSLSSTNGLNPGADGGLVLAFNLSRAATTTVQVVNSSGQVVATLAQLQPLAGQTDPAAPHQVWWDGYIQGQPASEGAYTFQLLFETDGATTTNNSQVFQVAYGAAATRESDWGLVAQPIAFDPATRDRIVRDPDGNLALNRAWITLDIDAQLADGTINSGQLQCPLKGQEGGFESMVTDTNSNTYIPISPLFDDAVQRLENIQVKFNGRVVDAFPPIDVSSDTVNVVVPSRTGLFNFKTLANGPKALRLQVVLRATLKPWMTGLNPVFNDQNQLFDASQVREFRAELEFREKPGAPGVLVSAPLNFEHIEPLWGYESVGGYFAARYGAAILDHIDSLELRDRNGQQILGLFNSYQIVPGGKSAVEQLFTLTTFSNHNATDAVRLDFAFETTMASLQAKAASLSVPVAFGYAGINGWLQIPTTTVITDDLDPFPTRYYHADGKEQDARNGGARFDNVKAYSGDSGLIQEIAFTSNRIAGDVPFTYNLRPFSDGVKGQQTMQVHPWVPYSFRKDAGGTWTVLGNKEYSSFGACVNSAGDVNGDGYDDIIVGDESYDTNIEHNRGRALLYLGGSGGLSGSPAWTTEGMQASAYFGGSVSGAGDVNGDGYDDVIVGAYGFANGEFEEGRAFLYLGGSGGLSAAPAWTAEGNQADAWFGFSVSGAGDVNGDGYGDVIVGARNFRNVGDREGRAFLYLGGPGGLSATPAWTSEGNQYYALFGSSVSGAGDVNGDGYDDVIVGAYGFDNGESSEGRAFLYLGGSGGLSAAPAWTAEGNQDGASFGSSVSGAGDVNGDGYDDVIVGANYFNNGEAGEGRAFLYLGGSGGLSATPAWTADGNQAYAYFGSSVSGAGDVNGDGFSDLLVGAYGFKNGGSTPLGGAFVYYGPRDVVFHKGWVSQSGGETPRIAPHSRKHVQVTANLQPTPLINTVNGAPNNIQVGLVFDSISKSNHIAVTYSSGQSGFYTNAPFPMSSSEATGWIPPGFYDSAEMAQVPVPVDGAGNVNPNWLLNVKFAASTNDMFVASSPGAYDATVTGVVDYTYVDTDNPLYDPTINYLSPQTAWAYVAPRLPGYPTFAGLPAVHTAPAERPRVAITNIVLRHDSSFPAITVADLGLDFTENPTADGGENAFMATAFSHADTGFFRDWSLSDDPNMQAAAWIETEDARVTLKLTRYVYDAGASRLISSAPETLLNAAAFALSTGTPVVQRSTAADEDSASFDRFVEADIEIRVTHPSAYATVGETETVTLKRMDLIASNRMFRVRSARYLCDITPVIGGPRSNTLSFDLGVTLDPPVEFSTRTPQRRGDRVALPLHVIDREKFWQVDGGIFKANLFREVAIEQTGQPEPETPGYIIDSLVGYTAVGDQRLLATDSNYAARANALFWKTSGGRVIPNPRMVYGDISVVLKDPSGQLEAPTFQEHRYVAAISNEYFHDLYLDQKDVTELSWTAKIRPQAKEHAYAKVYGSVGGDWTLAMRKDERGQLSGILPQDSGLLTWSTAGLIVHSGTGYGQNQFLTYWDITELNGPYILRLTSTASPDGAQSTPETQYFNVMLGQHLPGRNNPIFSPGGQPQMASIFSMHGRTQLVSDPEDRQDDDRFFTVNPIKIEEKPFSLRPDGIIPLGERVQVLPHTEHNPLSVNFYIDRTECNLYDTFRLYHQLEEGTLVEIASLPPTVRATDALIQGYVEHTSIVGFLPNPSLRLCTLNIPRLSPDGIIRAGGAVDLYGTDNTGVKNEDLSVAIVVSPTPDFYDGRVEARLATGLRAEFPIASQVGEALIPTLWTTNQPPLTVHVFAVVIDPNDDWLSPARQLVPADAGQHVFNISQAVVTMTTNMNGNLTIVGGLPVFSPNGDGAADTVTFLLDFQREGLAELEFRNAGGVIAHQAAVPLGTNGQATFVWNGLVTGQGALVLAPDGFYSVTARCTGGAGVGDTASVAVEVRTQSKYFGALTSAGITNNTGFWRTLWTHAGGTVYTDDVVRIQYANSADFTTVCGDRVVARPELSALFDDSPTNLTSFVANSNGAYRLFYRLHVTDVVSNLARSAVVPVEIPQVGRLAVVSVSPSPGAVNVVTEPTITINLAAPSPFAVAQLVGMAHLTPSVSNSLALSTDRRTITLTLDAALPPSTVVQAALQLYPAAPQPGADTFAWSFTVMSAGAMNRDLRAQLVDLVGTLPGVGAQATAYVTVTNAGNTVARLSLRAGAPAPNVLAIDVPEGQIRLVPGAATSLPVVVTVTGALEGVATAGITLVERDTGDLAAFTLHATVSSSATPPTLFVTPTETPDDSFKIRFDGLSGGVGPVSTMARFNGGGWWLVSQDGTWDFDAMFASDGDVIEIAAIDSKQRFSPIYRYTFAGPELLVDIHRDLSLSWDAQLGRQYGIQASTNLVDWAPIEGQLTMSERQATVTPGSGPVLLEDVPAGRLTIQFQSDHAIRQSPTVFFRVTADR